MQSGDRRLPDILTVIAISVIAGVITDVLHELIGHGGACVLSGLKPVLFSTVHFVCSADSRFVSAGGTIVNFIAAAISYLAMKNVRHPHWRFFFWVTMVFNLLDGAGYFLYSGLLNIGDWSYFIHDWHPEWAFRVGLSLVGFFAYWASVVIAIRLLATMLSPDREQSLSLARRYNWTAYLTSGVLLTLAGLFNPIGMRLVAISAMAASFGGHSGLAWMGQLLRNEKMALPSSDSGVVERSWAWIGVASALALVFILVIGRGVSL
jgi:hypothetical protein